MNCTKYLALAIVLASISYASFSGSEIEFNNGATFVAKQEYDEEQNCARLGTYFKGEEGKDGSYASSCYSGSNSREEYLRPRKYLLYIDGREYGSCEIKQDEGSCTIEVDRETAKSLYSAGVSEAGSHGEKIINYASKRPGKDLYLTVYGVASFGGNYYCGIPQAFVINLHNLGDTDVEETFEITLVVDGEEYTSEVHGIRAGAFKQIRIPGVIINDENGCANVELGREILSKVLIDPNNVVNEYDEKNNQFEYDFYLSGLSDGKNLGVGLVPSNEIECGKPFDLEYLVYNNGKSPIIESFILSLKVDGESIEEKEIAGIGAGETKVFHKEMTFEKDLHQIDLEVDGANKIEEDLSFWSSEGYDNSEFIHIYFNKNGEDQTYLGFSTEAPGIRFTTGGITNAANVPKMENETIEDLNETEEISLCKNITCKDYCSGNTLYSGGTCNENTGKCEYSSEVCENGCDAESARCIQLVGNIYFDVLFDSYYPKAVGSGQDTLKVTARLTEVGISYTPIEGAKVIFEVSPPEGSNVFNKYGGKMSMEGTTDSNGEAAVDIPVPAIEEFYPGYQGDTYVKVTVKASKHSEGMSFDYEDGPYTIEVVSPAISIERISISPNPAKAHETHDVTIKTSDAYSRGPDQYVVTATEGVLSYGKNIGEPGGGIGFDGYSREVHVAWEAPKRGLTPYEFNYAKELVGAGIEYEVGVGSSIVGVAFPIVKSGETLYGMYGDAKNILEEKGEYGESLSTREKAYRAFDIGVSEVKLGVGAVSLTIGATPGVGGLAKELVLDNVVLSIETGQAWLKKKAAEARWDETETRKIDEMIRVDVVDSEGYSDTDFLIYEMEYLWQKGMPEGSGGESW